MKQNIRLLMIEDHQDIAEMVISYLEKRGFAVDYAADGITGLHLAVTQNFDAIVLDLTLPGIDGLQVCEKIRNDAKKDTPIIMLTARDTLNDKVIGLDMGADDYLVKPFAIKELEARLNSMVRRNRKELTKEQLTIGPLTVDTSTLSVSRDQQELILTPIGFKILATLMRASPAVVSRNDLEKKVWGDILPDSDTLRSHIYNLRKIIDKPFDYPLLHTLQGTGYKVVDEH